MTPSQGYSELTFFASFTQDSRAYAAWLKEQRTYYSGGRQGDRKPEDDEFYPHGEEKPFTFRFFPIIY